MDASGRSGGNGPSFHAERPPSVIRASVPSGYCGSSGSRNRVTGGGCAWARWGEAAPARLTKIFRPGTLPFYGPKLEPRLLLAQRLRPDPAGNVEFLRRFWTFEDKVPGMAPAVLVYADLVTIGDARTLEAAKQLP